MGTIILMFSGYAGEFIFFTDDECVVSDVVEYVDQDGNVHKKQLDSALDNKLKEDAENLRASEDKSMSDENNDSANSNDESQSSAKTDARGSNDSLKSSSSASVSQQQPGNSESSSSDDGNGGDEPRRRWVPERTDVIHHPAETKKVKTCIVTCMCGAVFTAQSGPAAVAQYQAHRPNP